MTSRDNMGRFPDTHPMTQTNLRFSTDKNKRAVARGVPFVAAAKAKPMQVGQGRQQQCMLDITVQPHRPSD